MFPVPAGWKVARTGVGVMLVTSRPGTILVDEGLRPLASILDLVAAAAPRDLVHDDRGVVRLVTQEGEHAALLAGRTASTAYCFGFVFADDAYVRVVGAAPGGDDGGSLVAAVREIVTTTRQFLGSPRRRRFHYTAPPAWRLETASSGDETWLAPEYPARRASITVPRALPSAARQHMSIASTLLGLTELGAAPPAGTPIATSSGLSGRRWQHDIVNQDGVEMTVAVVALSDDRHDYFARLIAPSGTASDLARFAALVESIEPVPGASRTTGGVASFWVS